MEQIENMCRICRQESENMESLSGLREGLPLSVIIMVVCPIKILKKDSLPKLICIECLEVVLSAYKLREESIESDRYFKTFTDAFGDSGEAYEQPLRIKHENMFVESLPAVEKSPTSSKSLLASTSLRKLPIQTSNKKFDNSKKRTTASINRHPQADHDIKRNDESLQETINESDSDESFESTHKVLKKGSTPSVIGLTCPDENCKEVFKLKICLEIHLGLEHTGIADADPVSTKYIVQASDKNSKTMAWRYFGPLLDENLETIDHKHHYCRLCAGNEILWKYVGTVSTATLLQHLRRKHMENGKKRKRLEKQYAYEEDLSL